MAAGTMGIVSDYFLSLYVDTKGRAAHLTFQAAYRPKINRDIAGLVQRLNQHSSQI